MAEQITIELPEEAMKKLRTAGRVMGMSPDQLARELAMCATLIPQDHGVSCFRKGIERLLGKMGV